MTTLTTLLGERLLEHTTKDGVQTNDFIATSKLNGKTIGLYFSGHWCPPSRQFTPSLAEAYRNAYDEVKYRFDVVFISSDRDQESFEEYYHQMPWKALSFADRTRQQELSNIFQVRGIPCLIVLSPTGEIISRTGVQEISSSGAEAIRQWSAASSLGEEEEAVPITFADVDVQTDPIFPVKPVIVIHEDEETPLTGREKRSPRKLGENRSKFYLLLMGILCIILLLLALLLIFILFKFAPRFRKATVPAVNRPDIQDITFKAIFSTDYIWESKQRLQLINNLEDLTEQLNTKLPGNRIRLVKAYFSNNVISKKYRKIICKNPLFGNILQLHLIASFIGQCEYEDYMCKFVLKEQLKSNLTEIVNNTISIYFDNNRLINTNIKLCSLTEKIEEDDDDDDYEEESVQTTTTFKGSQNFKHNQKIIDLAVIAPYTTTSPPRCSLSPAKITFVLIVGQQGTELRDQTVKNFRNNDDENRPSTTVTLYESTVNVLRIQLDCVQVNRDDDYSCSRGYHIYVWIDLNNNGKFDEMENRIHQRSLVHSEKEKNTYDLEISIPHIDGISTKAGSHRMLLSLRPTDAYRKKCGKANYSETRNYKVNIIEKPTCKVNIPQNIVITKFFCSSNIGNIVLVLMGAELGTHIRDGRPTNLVNSEQYRDTVTLFRDAAYFLRIKIDCPRDFGNNNYYGNDCILAHHIDIFIDLNNDGIFDPSENRVYRRSLIDTETPENTYDLEIVVPHIDFLNNNGKTHRMQIRLSRSESYQKQCGKNEQIDIREYMVNIVQRRGCREREYAYQPEPEPEPESDVIVQLTADFASVTNCPPGNLVCSVGNDAIFSVKLSGEENTMINDATTQCNPTNNYEDRSSSSVKLFDQTMYTLHIQLYCVKPWNPYNSYEQNPSSLQVDCNRPHYVSVWIDLNNDGYFDDTNEQFFDNSQYNNDPMKLNYHFSVIISQNERINYLHGTHRMRIVLTSDQNNPKPCYNVGYGEARDYTVHIIPKQYY